MSDMENSLDLWPPEAVETYAEAWVAANTQTILTSDPQLLKTKWENLPTMVSPEPTETGDDDEEVLPSSSSLGTTPSQPTATPALTPTAGHHSGKSLPIHCIVEQAPSTDERGSAAPPVEVDSFAIIPGATLVCDILRTVLLKLGYSTSDCIGAKGQVLIKNWKPLTFDTITDNPDCTAEEIFGDLTSLITLKIRLSSHLKQLSAEEVKEKLLQFFLSQYQNALVSAGCPIDKSMLNTLRRGELIGRLPEDMRTQFDKWFMDKVQQNGLISPATRDRHLSHSSLPWNPNLTSSLPREAPSPPSSVPGVPNSQPPHMFHAYRPRVRTSFDPELEIPLLQGWFQQNQHPSREQMLIYMGKLNALRKAKGRKPLDLTNIIYWFKNYRAALRKYQPSKGGEINMDMSISSIDMSNGDADDSQSERLSPADTAETEGVPELPNKNAVYIVSDPMHYPQPTDLSTKGTADDGYTVPQDGPLIKQEEEDEDDDGEEEKREDTERNPEDNEPGELNTHPLQVDTDVEPEPSLSSSSRSSPATSSPTDARVPPPLLTSTLQEQLNLAYKYQASFSHYGHMFPAPPDAYRDKYPLTSMLSPKSESGLTQEELMIRKKRSRVFIDPLTEIPKLEKWFAEDTHPSSFMIEKYVDQLNRSEYRQRFPKLEAKNVQLWFKNHRAKVKRMAVGENSTLKLRPVGDLPGMPRCSPGSAADLSVKTPNSEAPSPVKNEAPSAGSCSSTPTSSSQESSPFAGLKQGIPSTANTELKSNV